MTNYSKAWLSKDSQDKGRARRFYRMRQRRKQAKLEEVNTVQMYDVPPGLGYREPPNFDRFWDAYTHDQEIDSCRVELGVDEGVDISIENLPREDPEDYRDYFNESVEYGVPRKVARSEISDTESFYTALTSDKEEVNESSGQISSEEEESNILSEFPRDYKRIFSNDILGMSGVDTKGLEAYISEVVRLDINTGRIPLRNTDVDFRPYVEAYDLDRYVLSDEGTPEDDEFLAEVDEALRLVDPTILPMFQEPDETFEGERGEFEDFEHSSEFKKQEDIRNHNVELLREVDKAVETTKDVLTKSQRKAFKKLLLEKLDAFGLDQRVCSMSKLQPIECIMEDNHPPICERARMMNRDKMEWLRTKIDDLVAMGMLEVDPNPTFGSPCFVVPKKGPKKYRMVVDMRLLNKYTKPTACDLPHLEQQLMSIGDSKYFCTMDLLHGFDFLPVHPDSTKYFVMTTPFGAYRMKGAPMGWCNTPALYQARIQQEVLLPLNLFCTEGVGICQWIDDSLLYGKTFEGTLHALGRFLDKLMEKNVRVNIAKCVFFQNSVEYCGRKIMSGGTWKFDEKFWKKVTNIPPPTTTTHLAQVIYICQWLSTTIPHFSFYRDEFEKITGPLNIKKTQLKQKERVIDWDEKLLRHWNSFQELLQFSAEQGLQNIDPDKELILLTDASADAWSLVIVQLQGDSVLEDDTDIDLLSLAVKPILFMSGAFTAGQKKWHIGQKELFPIVRSFTRCKYLLIDPTKTLSIVTGHSALKYIIKPKRAKNRSHAERLQR